jgi:hypothetical protein
MLDDLELPQVQELGTFEKRSLAEYKPPGMAGSVLQNLGRRPTRLLLWGVVTGPDALAFTEKLEGKFRDGKPVPFTADIIADAKIDQVMIDDLRLEQLAGKPERFAYAVELREFIKPLEPQDVAAPGLDAGILDDAKKLMDGLVDGLVLGEGFVSGLKPFVGTFGGFLTKLQQSPHP